MALGTTAGILLAGGTASAAMSIGAGNAQAKNIKKQAEYNAQIYDQQAEMIRQKKKLSEYQFNRQAAAMRGAVVARTAGKGLLMGGSPLAILIDNESQMQLDQAVSNYNMDVESAYANSAASYTRQTGVQQSRAARFSGYSNAFSTLLNTGTGIATMNMYKKAGKL